MWRKKELELQAKSELFDLEVHEDRQRTQRLMAAKLAYSQSVKNQSTDNLPSHNILRANKSAYAEGGVGEQENGICVPVARDITCSENKGGVPQYEIGGALRADEEYDDGEDGELNPADEEEPLNGWATNFSSPFLQVVQPSECLMRSDRNKARGKKLIPS